MCYQQVPLGLAGICFGVFWMGLVLEAPVGVFNVVKEPGGEVYWLGNEIVCGPSQFLLD